MTARLLRYWPALAFVALADRAPAEPARYELDPEHLTIAFLVEHIGYAKTLGAFREASGEFTFDDASGTLTAVRVTVATASVDTSHEARDGHLTSDDFLGSATHPAKIFTASQAERTGDRTFDHRGELELLGVRAPLVLEATWNKTAPYPIGARAEVIGVSLRGSLRRSAFGMTYGVADGLVGDDVELLIELEGIAREARP
jgi:polyisoprenoid-binding protein YceI